MYSLKKKLTFLLCGAMVLGMAACGEKTPAKSDVSSGSAGTSSDSQSADDASSQEDDVSSSEETGDRIVVRYEDVPDYQTGRTLPTVEEVLSSFGEADIPFSATPVAWSGPAGYTIIIPTNAGSLIVEAANALQSFFAEKAGVQLSIANDSTAASAKEIVIGNTNRFSKNCAEGDYYAEVSGQSLVFGGGHDLMAKKAVQIFIRLGYTAGSANTFSRGSDFVASKLGYSYVWGDEFEGTTLDLTRWDRSIRMSGTSELAISESPDIADTDNGYLKLFAKRYYNPSNSGWEYIAPWSITTTTTMGFHYGYLEMRARVPFVRGAWPSWWGSSGGNALGNRTEFYDYTIEVDFFEIFSKVDTVSPSVHKWYKNGDHSQWPAAAKKNYVFSDTANLVNEYHIYGVEWTETAISMYVDGEKYCVFDLTYNFDDGESGMSGFDTNLNIMFNCHLFTDSSSYKPYSGCEIYSADLPVEYDIDWIRLYQKQGDGSRLTLANS